MNADDEPQIARVEREAETEAAPARVSRRERLKARMDGYEKPQRVSPEQVRERWQNSADRRADLVDDTLDRVGKPSFWQPVVIGASVLAVGGMLWGASSDSDHFTHQVAADKAQFATLKKNVDAANKKVEDVPKTTDALKILQDVQKSGREIASNQQRYDTADAHKGEVAKIAASMRPFFTQYTLDGVSPWYSILREKTNPYANTKYQWEFATPYTFGSNGQSVNATWLCKDTKDGRVLAWAIGNYDVATKKFDGLTRGMTDEGRKRVGDAHEKYNDYDTLKKKEGQA